ncbi:hypothetical protein SDC9_09757 [bioreactor metagenome]|uniref:Uncharacterized protein n=1 Tax=bioreactor metagenome TaxID=1076179 RepID=A0A644TB16_9ZZZZ
MKNFIYFFLGVISGIIVTFLFLYIITRDENTQNGEDNLIGLIKFEKEGDCIGNNKNLKILQVIKPNIALAELENDNYDYESTIFLIINNEGKYYYDNQKISIPKGKCTKQIGIYNYSTKIGLDKTVPAVIIK